MSPFMQELQVALRPIMERLDALEKRFQEKWEPREHENRFMELKLRKLEGELAVKSLEVEQLRLDLEQIRARTAKENERERRFLEEKWAILQREAEARQASERGAFETQLHAERRLWEEKMARLREEHTHALEGMRRQESLWSRLIRMMTWS